MKKSQMQFDVRKAKIYKDIYRPSSSPSRFLGTLLSILLHGQSQVGGPDHHFSRKPKQEEE
ncbi:MAG TPA: hypothetical protein VNU72_01930 [Puia sp.]|nr:hypothetical protein [Puia sp.]